MVNSDSITTTTSDLENQYNQDIPIPICRLEDLDIDLKSNECGICKETYSIVFNCGHTYCTKCFMKWYIKKDNDMKCIYCYAIIDYSQCRQVI
jgi:hypothetical protein